MFIILKKSIEKGVCTKVAYFFSLTTFRNIWEREYSWLKVSGRAEDICSECFMFANRHKFLADHAGKYVGATLGGDGEGDDKCNDEQNTLNSAADGALFRGEPEDTAKEDDCPPPR